MGLPMRRPRDVAEAVMTETQGGQLRPSPPQSRDGIASLEKIEACCSGAGKANMSDPVDVLIIGSGASGAAVAWSLAETKMHIVCLEQGGWMNPAAYPATGRDWE